MTDHQISNNHVGEQNGHKEGDDENGSEVMLTTLETSSKKPNYDSMSNKERRKLLPGDAVMTRDEGMLLQIEQQPPHE